MRVAQGLAIVPQEFQLDATQRLIPIDYGDVCLNYDKAYFEQKKLQPPQTLADLTKDVVAALRHDGYRGRTVTLKIRFSDFETHTRSLSLKEPSDSEEQIRRAVFECLKRVELKKRVRLLGVRMSNLEKQ